MITEQRLREIAPVEPLTGDPFLRERWEMANDLLVARAEIAKLRSENSRTARQRDELLAVSEPVADALRDIAGDGHGAYLDAYQSVVDAIAAAQPSPRDWPEDSSDSDNGRYSCLCSACGCTFTGHKQRVLCKGCDAKPKAIEAAPCACCDNPASHIGSDGIQRCSDHMLNGDRPAGGA